MTRFLTLQANPQWFVLRDEQLSLRELLRDFLSREAHATELRQDRPLKGKRESDLWRRLASELGVVGVTIPDAHGGLGLSPIDLVVVLEEMGRSLACPSYFSTVGQAVTLVLRVGDQDDHERLLPSMADGSTLATAAIGEASTDIGSVTTSYGYNGDGWYLNGSKMGVIDGMAADVILVVAREPNTEGIDSLAVFAVDADSPGVTRTSEPTLDPTRPTAHVELFAAKGHPVGNVPAGASLWQALDEISVYASAEMLGGADRCLAMAVEYAQNRQQFGRPIGSFQAIKHKCANALIELEAARSAVYHAGWCAANDREELAIASRVALIAAESSYARAAADNIQIHGGIGFTWEHEAHLFYRRAHTSMALHGNPDEHRRHLLSRIG